MTSQVGPVVALIPARGGSKGLPRKNVLPVAGHPLIAYSIAAALESELVDRVICSTDDDEIAAVAGEYGAEVLRRPERLAADDTPDLPVFSHLLEALRSEGTSPSMIVQLRPTAPLRPRRLVDRCVITLAADPSATSVRTVAPAPHTPFKMWRSGGAEPYLEPLLDLQGCSEPYNLPRQSLPTVWWHNGSVDVIRPEVIDAGSMTGTRILPLEMSLADSVDIDDEPALISAAIVIGRRNDICRPSCRPWLAATEVVLSDVDGTLTPGTMHYSELGEELKSFHTRDGLGARLLREAGIVVGLVTGESSPIVCARAAKLDIEHVVLGATHKREAVGGLLQRLAFDGRTVVYLGDDVNDLPAAHLVHELGGRFVAVADAHPSVRAEADLVLGSIGGSGALRELADLILAAQSAAQREIAVRTHLVLTGAPMIQPVLIGDRAVGPGKPVYITAEIGINHNGDLDIAQRLIDSAVLAGCNAVKFQKRTPELCVPPEQRDILRETPWGVMTYLDYRYRVEFGEDDYRKLSSYCAERGVDWFASCWDVPSVEFMELFEPVCYKVASASVTDLPLLGALAATGRPIVLSTGMSTIEEIDAAVDCLGRERLILTHSTSSYPCPPHELNLSMITTLGERYQVPAGYSGHETGLSTTIAAVALGACFVERHITLDRAMWGTDQAASVEPGGLSRLVRDIRTLERAIGDGVKVVYESEIPIRAKLRRVS